MLRERQNKRQRMEMAVLEQMVSEDHLLRKIDATVGFSFIHELCAPLYCADNGRPAIEPEILFRFCASTGGWPGIDSTGAEQRSDGRRNAKLRRPYPHSRLVALKRAKEIYLRMVLK